MKLARLVFHKTYSSIHQPCKNWPCQQIPRCTSPISYMHHFVTEMCTYVHISVTKWCIVGHLSDVLWDLWDGSNKQERNFKMYKNEILSSISPFKVDIKYPLSTAAPFVSAWIQPTPGYNVATYLCRWLQGRVMIEVLIESRDSLERHILIKRYIYEHTEAAII